MQTQIKPVATGTQKKKTNKKQLREKKGKDLFHFGFFDRRSCSLRTNSQRGELMR